MKEDISSDYEEPLIDNNEKNKKKGKNNEDIKGNKIIENKDNFDDINSDNFSKELKDKSIYISIYNYKDFLILLSLFMCSSLNFNYLYLPFLLLGLLYLLLILNNKNEQKMIKNTFEIVFFIYSSLLLIFKIIIIFLINNENSIIL